MPDDDFTPLLPPVEPGPSVDVDRVIRRARRRRLPKQLAIGAASTFAVVGIVAASVQGLSVSQSSSDSAADSAASAPVDTYSEEAGSAALSTDDGIKRAPADRLNACTGVLQEPGSTTGLVLTTHFADASADAGLITGTVTLTNTTRETITGSSGTWVAITLSQNSTVLWHTNGAHTDLGREISLAPGGSIDFDAEFEPVACGVEDDMAEQFRDDLPHVESGRYQVSAAMDVYVGDTLELVTGPTANIQLD